jgi:nicotinamide phosphoribosyltransferase
MEHLVGEVITAEKIDEAENNSIEEFGHNYFNRGGFEYILNEHKGKLPIEITAVPEGSIIPSRNILMQIINTDENCAWLPNFLETILLHVWYPTTVCTNSYKLRMLIDSYAQKSGTRVTPFHVHDFGMRGVSSLQSSGIAGSAHLVNFLGSDNTVGRRYAKAFYNADGKDLSSTIYAAEHSTVISYGRDKELESYNNIIDSAPPELPISIVSDSYDHLHAVKEYFGDSLKEKIMSRTGKVVIRPNSGNGVEISDKTIELLGKSYGFIENSGGYKTLNPHVGVIYGDRVSEDAIKCILDRLVNRKKYSTDNIVFGIGKELTQAVNCDDYKFAFKASTIMVNDEWRDIKKTVVTDHTKASKAGRMKLIIDENGNYKTIPLDDEGNDVLKTIFKNGKITKKVTFDEIRKRSGWFDYY